MLGERVHLLLAGVDERRPEHLAANIGSLPRPFRHSIRQRHGNLSFSIDEPNAAGNYAGLTP
jgi:hypothetical protein